MGNKQPVAQPVAQPARRKNLSDLTPYTKKLVMNNTKSMHISCKLNTPQILSEQGNCVGIAIFLDNNGNIVEDNGVRVRSGYILVSNNTRDPSVGLGSRHKQVYQSVFRDIKQRSDCYIFGFGLINNVLKGRSGTFNASSHFQQRLLQTNERKEGLFYFRLVTFGAILSYKLSKKRNPSTYCSALHICLYQILKQNEDQIDIKRVPKIQIDHLDRMKVIFKQLGVHRIILNIACDYDEMWRITRWMKTKVALYYLCNGLKSEMTKQEFEGFIGVLVSIFNRIDIIVSFLRSLISGNNNNDNINDNDNNDNDMDLDDYDDFKIKDDVIYWCWCKTNDNWIPYDDVTSNQIEKEYQNNNNNVTLTEGLFAGISKNQYQILFDTSDVSLPSSSYHCIDNEQDTANIKFFYQKNLIKHKYRKVCRVKIDESRNAENIKMNSTPILPKDQMDLYNTT